MSPKHAGKLGFFLVCSVILAAPPIGCNPLATYSICNIGSIPRTEYPLVFKDGPKKDKEVVVAVFISSASGIGSEFAGSEWKLAADIAKILPKKAKEDGQKLVVLDPQEVNQFKVKNPNWKAMHPSDRAVSCVKLEKQLLL